MSAEEGEISYVEYYPSNIDENQFIIVRSSPMSIHNSNTSTQFFNNSSIANTPESVRSAFGTPELNKTPVRKITPVVGRRTALEDLFQGGNNGGHRQFSNSESTLSFSSAYAVTPDKDNEISDDQAARLLALQDSGKRGRPRADVINHLIVEGAQSGSNIKCKICHRVFPREKSLQAHLRTHTGEKPYNCDYPGCSRAFTQSGQLKTHQRLHAGEKPFVCSHPGCTNRYTHANRQCPDHPYAKPQRTAELILQPNISASEDKAQVMAWLDKYRREKDERTPGKVNIPLPPANVSNTPISSLTEPDDLRLSRSKRGLSSEMDECADQENVPKVEVEEFSSPETPSHSFISSPVNPRALFAQQKLNLALQRAAVEQQQLLSSTSILQSPPSNFSPLKRRGNTEQSPLKSVRRTLGDITPTKNCRSDMPGELDLPFNFGIPSSPAATGFSSDMALLRTPLSGEKYLTCSPGIQGSPALKLKKRFQERFQEEKSIERDELAKPILWGEDEWTTPVKRHNVPIICRSRNGSSSSREPPSSSPNKTDYPSSSPIYARDLSTSSPSKEISSHQSSSLMRETSSPRLLVAAALVELGHTNREDIPLNLTKQK